MTKKIVVVFHAVMLALGLGAAGCAIDESPTNADDQNAVDGAPEPLDTARAAAIAKVKMASIGLGADAVPLSAACGKQGSLLFGPEVGQAITAARMRTGSSTACPQVGVVQVSGNPVLYYCYTVAAGFTWTWLWNEVPNKFGWVRDDLLEPPFGASIGGSTHFCGF